VLHFSGKKTILTGTVPDNKNCNSFVVFLLRDHRQVVILIEPGFILALTGKNNFDLVFRYAT